MDKAFWKDIALHWVMLYTAEQKAKTKDIADVYVEDSSEDLGLIPDIPTSIPEDYDDAY